MFLAAVPGIRAELGAAALAQGLRQNVHSRCTFCDIIGSGRVLYLYCGINKMSLAALH